MTCDIKCNDSSIHYPDCVAQRVQGRRPHPDPHDVGDDEDEGARYAGLGRKADVEGKLPGIVVHAAAVHERQHIPGI